MATLMATQNYYREERKTYWEAYDFIIHDDEVELILKKLCRHYKVRVPNFRFYGHRDSGSAGYGGLRLSHEPSMGLILHEFGHYVLNTKIMKAELTHVSHKGTSHHGLRFQTCLWRVNDWAKGKGYWRDELTKKRLKKKKNLEEVWKAEHATAMRTVDPKEVIRDKIAEAEKKILKKLAAKERYEKKLKRLQKLYSTKTKKANRSIGALKRAIVKYNKELDTAE